MPGGMHTYEDLLRALLWPNAIAAAPLVPHAHQLPMQHLTTVCEGIGGFCVAVDVHQFAPRELNVKVKGRSIIVEGHHEEQPDEHGYVTRHFVRRYVLPDEYDAEHVTCALSIDGVLTLAAPKAMHEEGGVKTKMVPIVVSGTPVVKHTPALHHVFADVKAGPPEHSAKPASHHGL